MTEASDALRVRDLMTTDVVSVAPETPVDRIARLMGEREISGLPVVDEGGHVVGIVTDLDLIARNARLEPPAYLPLLDGRIPIETPGHYRRRLRHMLGSVAKDVMTEDVVTIGPDEDVETLATLMEKRKVNPVPVVEDGRMVGIVSRADVVRLMAPEPARPK
jgi:CBS domain-containing protein